MAETLQSVTVPMGRHGYSLEAQTRTSLTFVRSYRPWYVWVVTIGLFPLGLLAYLAGGERAYVTLSVGRQENQTLMRVSGEGTKTVSEAFCTMSL